MDPNEIKKQQELQRLQRQLEDIKKLLERVAFQNEKKQAGSPSPEALLRDESAEYDPSEWEKILKELGNK